MDSQSVRWSLIARYTLLILLSIIFLAPFYILIRNAFMTRAEIAAFDWIFFPESLQWNNLTDLFSDPIAPMASGLWNSAIISTFQVAGELLFPALAAYGLAKIPFRWRNIVFVITLIALMVPPTAIFIPAFLVVDQLGWVNTLQGIIVPRIFNVFNLIIFRQFFLAFPKDIEEAGQVDGLNYWGIFWRLVVPNSVGIFVALGSISLLRSWNGYLWPLVIGQSKDTWTVQVVLSTFMTAQTINLPALFMGSLVAVLPMVIVFFLLQRFIVQGVTSTGLKG
ncbi:MAG: carbohydrate ABC transporter permease [Phototrophicaceae bacterium]